MLFFVLNAVKLVGSMYVIIISNLCFSTENKSIKKITKYCSKNILTSVGLEIGSIQVKSDAKGVYVFNHCNFVDVAAITYVYGISAFVYKEGFCTKLPLLKLLLNKLGGISTSTRVIDNMKKCNTRLFIAPEGNASFLREKSSSEFSDFRKGAFVNSTEVHPVIIKYHHNDGMHSKKYICCKHDHVVTYLAKLIYYNLDKTYISVHELDVIRKNRDLDDYVRKTKEIMQFYYDCYNLYTISR